MFMNCPDCGLKVRLVAPYLLREHCPRCLVRRRRIVEMRVEIDPANDGSASAPQARRRMSKEPPSSVGTSPGVAPSEQGRGIGLDLRRPCLARLSRRSAGALPPLTNHKPPEEVNAHEHQEEQEQATRRPQAEEPEKWRPWVGNSPAYI
jgi:hypothetical protein